MAVPVIEFVWSPGWWCADLADDPDLWCDFIELELQGFRFEMTRGGTPLRLIVRPVQDPCPDPYNGPAADERLLAALFRSEGKLLATAPSGDMDGCRVVDGSQLIPAYPVMVELAHECERVRHVVRGPVWMLAPEWMADAQARLLDAVAVDMSALKGSASLI